MAPSTAAILPILTKLSQASSFELTVKPYLPQLYDLPARTWAACSSLDELHRLYLSTNPLILSIALSLALAPLFLLISELNKNYSQVDRVWSILPSVHAAHYNYWAHAHGLPTKRLDTILAVLVVWSCRLTYNYWRRGGYQMGSEDYRWEIVQTYVSKPLFFLFNVVFISTAQSILLMLITMPIYVMMLASRVIGDEMSTADNVISKLMVALIVLEWFGDQQQQNYQNAKYAFKNSGKLPQDSKYSKRSLERGFNTHGLWSISRHPNFAAEQTIWVTLYQWSCYETYNYWNWTVLGAIGYLTLFQASTRFTEMITAKKYPKYREYQRRVSMFLPKLMTAVTGPVPEDEE